MAVKEAYEDKLQAQIDEVALEIDQLKAKAKEQEADVEVDYYEELDKLEAMKETLASKLQEIKDAGDDALEDLKIGAQSAYNALKGSIKSASTRFD